jgi:4-amino-4-deoxy-L-arabinose transferase-like glycosyltransferase
MGIDRGQARRAFFALYIWVLLGFGLRLWRALLQVVMFRDETAFAFEIKHVLQGTIFQDGTYFVFPPAFAFLAAPIAIVTGDAELAGRLVSCIMGAATAIPVYYLTRDLFGLKAAAFAAPLAALFPVLIVAPVMSEPTYTFFIALGLYMGNRAYNTGRGRDYALFGAVMAASYLSRPEGFFVFFAYLALLFILLFRDKAGIKRVFALGAMALAGFFVLAFPYMLQLKAGYGAWELSGKTRINLAKMKAMESMMPGESLDDAEARVSKEFGEGKKSLIANLLTEFSAMARRYPGNLVTEGKSLYKQAGLPLLLAFAAGLLMVLAMPGRLRTLAPLLAIMAPLLSIPVVFVLDRILSPYLSVVFVIAAYGASRLSELAGKKAQSVIEGRAVMPAATFVFAAGLFMGNFGYILPETDVQKMLRLDDWYGSCYDLRQTAEQVRPFIQPGSGVITRNNIFAYYAGGEYLPIPVTDIAGLMDYARRNRARYLFYGSMEQQMRPQYYPVLLANGYPQKDPLKNGELMLVLAQDDFLLYEFSGQGDK